MDSRIYADHHAGSPLRPEALEAMRPFLGTLEGTGRAGNPYGNPMSLHADGRRTRAAVENARDRVAHILGAKPAEIVFTSGATESIHLALLGAERTGRAVVSAIEHPAGLEAAPDAALAPARPDGIVDLDALRSLSKGAGIVSVMHANNETGAVQPIEEARAIAHEAGALFHTDAAQTAGKIPIRAREWKLDLLSLSAVKFGGPAGVGALFIRNGVQIRPLMRGGPQERMRRPGTENAAGIVGAATALENAAAEMDSAARRLRTMTRRLIDGAARIRPDIRVNTPKSAVPGAANIAFKNVNAESLTIALDLLGISVSTGSACASGSVEPSHVLRAMRIPEEYARGAVRFSFGWSSQEADVDRILSALATAPPTRQRRMKITFLGTGTSTGVPVIACECRVCQSEDPRNKRLRVSALLSWEEKNEKKNIVIDTGPDFRQQMLQNNVKHVDAVLYTHSHADHLYGLDDIRIFCFRAGGPIPVYADPPTLDRIRTVYDYTFQKKTEGGGVAKLDLRPIQAPFPLFGKTIEPIYVWHGSTPVLCFRIDNFAYCTDCSAIPPEAMERLRGLDLLVLDALRPYPHSTHMSIPEAVAAAQELKPKQTYFVHMTHDVEHAETEASLPEGIHLAYDGLEIEI